VASIYAGYRDDPEEVDWIDELQLGETRYRRARKSHACSTCVRQILPNQIYGTEFWLVDGKPSYVKHCDKCLDEMHGIYHPE